MMFFVLAFSFNQDRVWLTSRSMFSVLYVWTIKTVKRRKEYRPLCLFFTMHFFNLKMCIRFSQCYMREICVWWTGEIYAIFLQFVICHLFTFQVLHEAFSTAPQNDLSQLEASLPWRSFDTCVSIDAEKLTKLKKTLQESMPQTHSQSTSCTSVCDTTVNTSSRKRSHDVSIAESHKVPTKQSRKYPELMSL